MSVETSAGVSGQRSTSERTQHNFVAGGKRLKIAVVNWQCRENPMAGGAEIHLHEIFGRLAAAGHEVVLHCGGWPGCEPRTTLDGIEVHRVGTRQTWPFKARAYLDLSARKDAGDRVDSKNVKKHRNDVFRVLQLLPADTVQPLPDPIRADMQAFMAAVAADELFTPSDSCRRPTR